MDSAKYIVGQTAYINDPSDPVIHGKEVVIGKWQMLEQNWFYQIRFVSGMPSQIIAESKLRMNKLT